MAILNFIRDYERLARFKFGRFQGMKGPGPVWKIPIIHQIKKVDTRTQVIDIPRQTNITRDNASIGIDFLIYLRVDINSAERAVMEVEDYRQAVAGLATTTLRAVVGDISLDDVLSQRERINELIRSRLDTETERWGIKVTNVEIREIDPPREILEAMNRQMSAERLRRAVILEADGTREASIKVAEGQKQAEILKAEGDQQAAALRALGFAQALESINGAAQGASDNTMGLQYLEALKALGTSPAAKFIFPMEFSNFLRAAPWIARDHAASGNGHAATAGGAPGAPGASGTPGAS
jgi:regulator of protease activity HflC (stomatin/prohibitin superfamily)